MKELIIKRSNKYNKYILKVEGYITQELEQDLEEMAEDFAFKEELITEEMQQAILGLKRYYKDKKGFIIRFNLDEENERKESTYGLVRSIKITIYVRKKFAKWLQAVFFS